MTKTKPKPKTKPTNQQKQKQTNKPLHREAKDSTNEPRSLFGLSWDYILNEDGVLYISRSLLVFKYFTGLVPVSCRQKTPKSWASLSRIALQLVGLARLKEQLLNTKTRINPFFNRLEKATVRSRPFCTKYWANKVRRGKGWGSRRSQTLPFPKLL